MQKDLAKKNGWGAQPFKLLEGIFDILKAIVAKRREPEQYSSILFTLLNTNINICFDTSEL